MTAYRLRVKPEHGDSAFWRDVVVGGDRTLAELQAAIAEALGLPGRRLWFFGTDRDYWESPVKYLGPYEYEELSSGGPMRWDEDVYSAADTPVRGLGLGPLDRFCYLHDYVRERRFYAIVVDVEADEPDDRPPEVVGVHGDADAIDWPTVGNRT